MPGRVIDWPSAADKNDEPEACIYCESDPDQPHQVWCPLATPDFSRLAWCDRCGVEFSVNCACDGHRDCERGEE